MRKRAIAFVCTFALLIAAAFGANEITGYTVDGAGAGGFTIGLPSSASVASVGSTTFPAFSTNATSGMPHLAFDGATQEATQWHGVVMPASYDDTSDLNISIQVSSGSTSQATSWGLRIAALAAESVSQTPDALLDTVQIVTGTTSASANNVTTLTWTLAKGLIDDADPGDPLIIQLDRQAASAEDASTVDVFVHAAWISQ